MATISENLEALKAAKTNIKNAIEGKGQDLSNVAFVDYDKKINNIQIGITDEELDLLRSQNNALESTLGKYLPKPIVYGIRLDKESKVAGEWESYTDDAIDLEPAYMDFSEVKFYDNGWTERWPFNQIKPVLMHNGEILGYLNPQLYTKFEDGSSATINDRTVGQVMIEFPKIYYKISKDDRYVYVKISDQKLDGFTDAAFWRNGVEHKKIYVAAYLAGTQYLTSQGFWSISGQTINNIYSVGYEKYYSLLSKYSGENFEFMPYNVLVLLQCLYLIMFRNTNIQASLGHGYSSISSNYKTGKGNSYGMYYGRKSAGYINKLFGIEDLYGGKKTVITGLYIDANGTPRYIDPYDKNMTYDPADIDKYKSVEGVTINATESGVATDVYGINELGFLFQDTNTDLTNGFADYSLPQTSSSAMIHGTTSTDTGNGLFNMETTLSSSTENKRSIRLVYYPVGG